MEESAGICRRVSGGVPRCAPIPAGYRGRKGSAFALLGGLAEPVSTEGIAHAATLGGAAVAGGSGGRLLGGNPGFPFLLFEIRFGFHGEGDAVPLEIDFGDGDLDLLTDFDGFVGVLDEVVGELADVDEAILVDAYVDEGPERGDVGDDAGQLHADGEVGWFFHAVGEGEGLELAAGVAAGFREFRHDVLEGGKTHIGADIFSEVDGFPPVFVADEVGHGAAGVRGHACDQSVAFWVDGGGVERVCGFAYAEESGSLFDGLVGEAVGLGELGAGFEWSVFVAEGDDVFGDGAVEAGDVAEELFAGGIDFDADSVHAAHDAVVEGVFEGMLIDVVLVLADADAFRVDFDEFGEGVHEATADGDGSADGHVFVREFLAGDVAGGVDGSAAFVDGDDGDGRGELEAADEGFGFAAGGAVADGDGFDAVFFDEGEDGAGGFDELGLAAGRWVDDVVVEEFSLGVEDDGFAACAESWVDGEEAFLAERSGEEEFADVVCEDADGFGIRLFLGGEPGLGFHGGEEESLAAVAGGEADLVGSGAAAGDGEAFDGVEGAVFRDGHAEHEEAFFFAAAHGEEAVAGNFGEGFAPFEVVAVFGGVVVRFLACEDLAGDGGFFLVDLADGAADGGVVGDSFGDDIAGTCEGFLGGLDAEFLLAVLTEEPDGFRGWVGGGIGLGGEKPLGEGFEAFFLCDGGAGAAFRAEGSEDVLEAGHGFRLVDLAAEGVGEQFPLVEAFEDGGAPLVEFGDLEEAVADAGDLDFVEHAGDFLAVAGDEGDGAASREQFRGGGDLGRLDFEFGGYFGEDGGFWDHGEGGWSGAGEVKAAFRRSLRWMQMVPCGSLKKKNRAPCLDRWPVWRGVGMSVRVVSGATRISGSGFRPSGRRSGRVPCLISGGVCL